MGREIRRVPANWEHPRGEDGKYLSMHDRTFAEAADEWTAALNAWDRGEDPDREKYGADKRYWEWNGEPPERDSYRPEFTSEPTWFQVYQTVSEGYPVTPPFATEGELIEHLATHGTDWDEQPWSRAAAEQFVNAKWAPSMMVSDGRVYDASTGFPEVTA